MCGTEVQYSGCGHTLFSEKPCQRYLDLVRDAAIRGSKPKGFFKKLVAPKTPKRVICPAPRGFVFLMEVCPACKEKRYRYLCSKCYREGRRPSQREREANAGFCCSNGQDEGDFGIESSEPPRGRYESPVPPPFPRPNLYTPTVLVNNGNSRSSRQSEIDIVSQATNLPGSYSALSNVRQANRLSTHFSLEEDIVAQAVNVPGANSRDIRSGLGIQLDESRWRGNVQTGHGTIPAPNRDLTSLPLLPVPPPRNPARNNGLRTVSNPQRGSAPAVPSRLRAVTDSAPRPPTRRGPVERRIVSESEDMGTIPLSTVASLLDYYTVSPESSTPRRRNTPPSPVSPILPSPPNRTTSLPNRRTPPSPSPMPRNPSSPNP